MIRNHMRTIILASALLTLVLPASAQKKGTFDIPSITCAASSTGASIAVNVTAGVSGAPAGFDIHWMLESDYLLMGWPAEGGFAPESFCEAGFSGNANLDVYNLDPAEAVTVELGDILFDNPGASSACENVPLQSCGTKYVFRVRAKGNSNNFKSDWSGPLVCATLPCASDGCTYTQGFWKTHGPVPTGNNDNEWPVTSLTIGSVTYTDLELLSIFNTKPSKGNGLVSLAHQLIAARLNEANGADVSAVTLVLGQADTLIGGLVIPPVGAGFLPSSTTDPLNNTLADFNEGLIGPGHCGDEEEESVVE